MVLLPLGLPVNAFIKVDSDLFNILKKGSLQGYFWEPHNTVCSRICGTPVLSIGVVRNWTLQERAWREMKSFVRSPPTPTCTCDLWEYHQLLIANMAYTRMQSLSSLDSWVLSHFFHRAYSFCTSISGVSPEVFSTQVNTFIFTQKAQIKNFMEGYGCIISVFESFQGRNCIWIKYWPCFEQRTEQQTSRHLFQPEKF